MLKYVIKHDGRIEEFSPEKLNKWAMYATKRGGNWSEIALSAYKRLPETAKSSDLHQTLINVCLYKEDIAYSRIAARLELAMIRKNMERHIGINQYSTFKDIYDVLMNHGYWKGLPVYNPKWEELFKELNEVRLEYWQIVQWGDKYSIKYKGNPIETPHIGAMGIALALHGDNQHAYDLARAIIKGQVNLPTPALNGIRNGDFDTISCCVISGGDSVESIVTAEHIATRMTAKKAGIGIEYDTRSKGAPVKGGAVEHLGKHSIYSSLDKAVKMFTQITRGGSATVYFKCIDPEVENITMWKTQRVDIETRLDKLDYGFTYNDSFVDAVVKDSDWYLFDLVEAPEVHETFFDADSEKFKSTVQEAIDSGKKYTKVKARDILKTMLIARNETGRMYSMNATRANEHTPFLGTIRLTNLCSEVFLETKPYNTMSELYSDDFEIGGNMGETAFCTLAAVNAGKVSFEEYPHVAEVALRAVDVMIDKAPMMTGNMKNSIQQRRSAGIGIMGLAAALYNNGMDYDDSEESKQFVSELAELHYHGLLKASQLLAEESGFSVKGIKEDWLPIDTRVNKTELKLDWESLRGKPRKNSVLVAHMPTESSSLFSDGPNGLYPVRQKVINKKSRKGVVQYICKEWDESKKLAWDIDNITLSRYYSLVQDFTDQGISCDYYFDPSKYADERKPLSELMKEWVAQARMGNKSQYYINTRDFNGGSVQDTLKSEIDEEACESCKL